MIRPIRNGQRVLDALCDRLWPPGADLVDNINKVRRRPVRLASDAAVLLRARNARNGALFTALWDGRWQDRYGSQSEADLALCGLLAFWCDGDAGCVDRLFRQSGLHREKWDRSDYRRWTLERACAGGRS